MALSKVLTREKESRVFQDLSGTKISDLTIDEYNNLISNSYLQADNLEFLRDLSQIMTFQEKPKGLQLVKYVG
jgi:hypothetical protein